MEVYDVVIAGGSYAGLSAALSLGRALRNVLVIDSGNPCNRKAAHSHNFLTNDGSKPRAIHEKARTQAEYYPSVRFMKGLVTNVVPADNLFKVSTEKEGEFLSRKVLFATGITDTIPNIEGFSECWGISILHCPYCHGYEIRNRKTGILANGDTAFEMAKTIRQWTKDLTLFTNGTSTLNPEQVRLLNKNSVIVVENAIDYIEHDNGCIQQLHFKDAMPEKLAALFTQLPFIQQCGVPEQLGCEMTEKGFIQVSKCMETSVPGIYAAGDCLSLFRSVANAVASGNKAGALINKQLTEEEFI
ncbi:pyridine nucleotide-disulfide oxidoreductase [Flavobacterium cyanobacteriorum]|uniref:Pyridine nucleotide-disulfide oxidoreductase n=1 Tax=Flavobacterium cyanobacteriorum TaxID=2022802 RepID=A0A255Z9I9_9FLAO|nr:NAD(P)/FAD-dependent oxidoreductase [Flavobacterium cyanobacteriorum]OYQ38081.1 pyridine nucleotide-disulfide oxidoreductase [Flavobacterium cyanobacteriorum]